VIAGSVALKSWLLLVMLLASTGFVAAPYHPSSSAFFITEAGVLSTARSLSDHANILAAGFGFQAADSSVITIRTYDAATGDVLSEDSFDVNVKEEGVAKHDGSRGRIFAGGMGTGSKGKSAFMLRVYDAENGRFLWEGQLNLLKVGEGGTTRAGATIIPSINSVVQVSDFTPKHLQSLYSVRAVNPVTGSLVWEDQFAPGIRKRARSGAVLFHTPHAMQVSAAIGHVFDLVVRTYDRATGTLLWEDSFEQLNRIEESAIPPQKQAHPQTIPLWNGTAEESTDGYQIAVSIG
jgi:hypothetical protein